MHRILSDVILCKLRPVCQPTGSSLLIRLPDKQTNLADRKTGKELGHPSFPAFLPSKFIPSSAGQPTASAWKDEIALACGTGRRPRCAMRHLCLLLISVSLAARAGAGPVPKDEWGHRPGPRGFTTVMIDAGHGGKDSGAVSATTGQREKDAALDVARRVAGKLAGNFRVKLLRNRDQFIDLDERVKMATAGADVLVSIHFNSGPAALVGPETFFWRVDSHGLAVRLQQALRAAVPGPTNSRGLVRRRIRLTRNPAIPCVLVECGYLSSATEARRIAEPAYRDRLAGAIADALRQQAARGDDGTGPLPKPLHEPPSRPTDARE